MMFIKQNLVKVHVFHPLRVIFGKYFAVKEKNFLLSNKYFTRKQSH